MERPARRELARAIKVVETARRDTADTQLDALLEASQVLLLAADTPQPIGQCKQADPFKPIYVVFDADGHRYECTHDPPHSAPL